MKKKIFYSLIFVSVMVLFLSSAISTTFLHSYFNKEQENRLHIELELVADAVNELGLSYLAGVDDEMYRFTVVDTEGMVVYDTKADVETMENHAKREEIVEAFESGNGSSARYSSTLTEKTFYEAVKLNNGMILRVSISQLALGGAFLRLLPMNLFIAVIAIILSLAVSARIAHRITKPLFNLDLDHPIENDTYEELSPVLTKIHRQHKQLGQQMAELKQKNNEFSQIISSMSEGLVLLNEHGIVVAMNRSAKEIFNVKGEAEGTAFLVLERSPEISHAVEQAIKDAHAEVITNKNGCEYQFTISRIESEGRMVGILILGFDITAKIFAERHRQEFTANVSHELKTPLQSIIGSAELLENGLVKPEDTARFIGNIKNEASRLVTLINDVIQLSQMDEKLESINEMVDLKVLSDEVMEILLSSAEKRKVTLSSECAPVIINGVRRYLYEMIYNLCDNAIRYNKEGGEVRVEIKKQEENVIIKVTDTGIGIPKEHQTRIFERFYRVDKSHSKETGGTGLGLSIVKHAVMLHHGRVELNSTEGVGTEVKITLPCRTNIPHNAELESDNTGTIDKI